MPINTADFSMSAIKEVEPGVVPTTGSRVEVPIKTDQAPPVLTTAQIEDDTKRPNREGNAAASGHSMVELELSLVSRGGELIDMLIESAISGEFDGSDIAKGSDKDSTFTIFSTLKSGNAGQALVYVDSGCMVRSWSVTATAKEGAEVSFGILGTKREEEETESALPLIKTPDTAVRHLYSDVTVTVGDQELAYSSLEFSTEQERDVRVILGQIAANDIYTSGTRTTSLTIKAYRESFAVNALANTNMPVEFTIGTAGNGYKITLPFAKLMTPTDELDDSGLLVNLEFNAGFDNTTEAGIIVERL